MSRNEYTHLPLPERLIAQTLATPTCHLWQGTINRDGYGIISIGPQGAAKNIRAHRLAWELTYGPIPVGLFVCHRCNVKACLRLDHLYLGTPAENARDAARDGLMPTGARHGSQTHPERIRRGDEHPSRLLPERLQRGDTHYARTQPERLARGDRNGTHTHPERLRRGSQNNMTKLTEAAVREIRARSAAGETRRALGAEFGVTPETISHIVLRQVWRHVV